MHYFLDKWSEALNFDALRIMFPSSKIITKNNWLLNFAGKMNGRSALRAESMEN